MSIETITQMLGFAVVGAASMRAAYSVFSFAGRKFMFARREKRYIAQFQNAAAEVFREHEAGREKPGLSWAGKRKFQIVKRVYEDLDRTICSFYLRPCDGRPVAPFRPGQFLTFTVPVLGEEPEMRCYSISSTPLETRYYRVTVKRLAAPEQAPPDTPPGRLSGYFHDQLHEGTIVEAYAPAGAFCLEETSQRPVVLIAGGVGLTPLMSMLDWLAATGSTREIWLFYGVRNSAEHAMYEHLQRLAGEMPNLRVVVAYSRPTGACRKGADYHFEGHVTAEFMRPVLMARNCEIYLCGPAAMMAQLASDFEAMGIPAEDIRREAFGPAPRPQAAGEKARREENAAEVFHVEFARSGKTVGWSQGDGSLLDLALAHGVKARCGCRQGICGTCAVALRQGSIDYAQPPEKPPRSGMFMPCIGRPSSDVVIDL